MSNKLIDEGGSVVFAQRYLPGEPNSSLHNRQGIVRSLLTAGKTAMIEFNFQPGKLHKVSTEDLEPLPTNPDDIISLEECEPLEHMEEYERHELGGMSKSQLITHKIYAQENDPSLDRSLSKLIN